MIRGTSDAVPPIPVKPLVDRILDGNLDALLKDWRDEGLSFDAISRRLLVEHSIDVGADTVRKWLAEATA